jgi:hypothetical protein
MPLGMVQPAVKVLADASYSYALYLPSKYSTQKRWPLLLAFDPGGEGVYPVELFHEAAEKYGFIVIGSNNSRNFEDPSTAIRLMWGDISKRYAIDPRRMYTTGFSGGSRVAGGVAIGCKTCIAGVISCGAGLPLGVPIPPPETADWFLTAGTLDFNYSEIIHLADAMDSHHFATHIAFFPGPHSWMPPAVAEEALAWMQLRAMVKGTAPLDKEFVESEFNRQVAAAKALQASYPTQSTGAIAAFRAYRQIINDFRTLHDIKDVQAAHDSLAASDDLKRSRKSEQALLDLQDRTAERINVITNGLINRQKPEGILYQELESLMKDIRRDRDSAQDTVRRDALSRGMSGAFAYARETASDDMLKKNFLTARTLFKETAILRPESAWPHYFTATASAHLGETKLTLEELTKAADQGFNSPQMLEAPDFDKLRNDAAFKEISARVVKNAAKRNN